MSTVARVIDVLVSSYSHSIKTGNYLKGNKSGKTLTSGVPHTSGPKSSADASASRVVAVGKSRKYESSAGVDSESPNRFLTFSNSDSEEDAGFQFFDSKIDRGKLIGAETSASEVRSSLVNNPLDINLSEQQDSQLTSPAISPDEMYSFVFAPVEEEMVGEPSYLVAIIVEFLRRYAIFL